MGSLSRNRLSGRAQKEGGSGLLGIPPELICLQGRLEPGACRKKPTGQSSPRSGTQTVGLRLYGWLCWPSADYSRRSMRRKQESNWWNTALSWHVLVAWPFLCLSQPFFFSLLVLSYPASAKTDYAAFGWLIRRDEWVGQTTAKPCISCLLSVPFKYRPKGSPYGGTSTHLPKLTQDQSTSAGARTFHNLPAWLIDLSC